MLSRLSALYLVALILLPFSAPFPTCDAAMLFHADRQPTHQKHAPIKTLGEAAHTVALPLTRVAARIRFVPSTVRTLATVTVVLRMPAEHGAIDLSFVRSPFLSPLRI